MTRIRSLLQVRRVVVALVLGTLTGCTREDGERLGRIGRTAADRIRGVAPDRTPFGELAPDHSLLGRVRKRLKDDKYLTHSGVEANLVDGAIVLQGRVPTGAHSKRAVELAETTVGVERVVDETTPEKP